MTRTQDITVRSDPVYVPEKSNPADRLYFFAYRVRVTNASPTPVQLISRYWKIVDALGRAHEVEGDGVVGKRPRIAPGESFEYASHCPLKTPWGTMEGSFLMRSESGEEFRAGIGRFYLISEPGAPPARR